MLLESTSFWLNISSQRTSPEALKHSESFVVHLTSCHGTSYVTFAYVTKENLDKFMVNVT